MKKIVFIFVIFCFLLMISIVSAVNSSYVISKIADEYAPDYKITYEKISGNIFTGIEVENLKYDNKTISNTIIYKWNPLNLLQKKISINQIKIKNANINVIKSLIASFDVDESDDNSSGSFNFDVEVDNIDISIEAFTQEGIAIDKSVFRADDIMYHSDGSIDINNLYVDIDSNLTQFTLKGSMQERELLLESLEIDALDTHMLEDLINSFSHAKQNNTGAEEENNKEAKNQNELEKFFVPTNVKILSFKGSVLAREYMSIAVNVLDISVDNIDIDIVKIFENQKNAIDLESLTLKMDTNITSADIKLSLHNENLKFDTLTLKNIDTESIKRMLPQENNESKIANKEKKYSKDESNIWIPKHISINTLQADFLAANHGPFELKDLTIVGNKIGFDIDKSMVDNGDIEIKGSANVSDIHLKAKVHSNLLQGKLTLVPKKALFTQYDLPLRAEAIDSIKIDLNASKNHITADIHTQAKQILHDRSDGFNIDINSLIAQVNYDIKTKKIKAKSKAIVNTPYANNILLTNRLISGDTLSYEGHIKASTLSGLDTKIIEPLKNLDIAYRGDDTSINAKLLSKQLKGSFNSDDMKKGRLLLETLEVVNLNEFVGLPKELNTSKMNVKIDFPINFDTIEELNGKIDISSNLINMDADIIYDKNLKIQAKTMIPKKSLLREFNKEVEWNALTPMNIDVTMKEENLIVGLNSKVIQGNAKYHLQNHNINGKIKLAGLSTTIQGNSDTKMKVNTKVTSIKMLEKSISSLYKLKEFPPIEGTATLNASITEMKRVNVTLTSPKLTYKADRKTKHILNDFKATASLEDSKVVLDSYSLRYNNQKFFSTKPSKVNMEDEVVTLESIWLNDTLNVTGQYNMKTKQGVMNTKASNFQIEHEYANIEAMIDVESKFDGNNTNIDGKVVLLGGKITYDIHQKSFANDSDIIFVHDIKKNSDSPFMKNLTANINITTKEPLVMKQNAIHIKLKPELGIHKVKNDKLMVLGSVGLLKGGTYTFEGKKFVLAKSAIHFTGNPNKPLLDIKVKYRSLNHRITILVSGTPNAPVINFSSNPSLTKEQILSLILFDTEVGGDAHSGDEMMKMMGGAMAKSALSNLGVKLDHLVLGEGNSIEVGKKLTDKITIIYVDGEVSRVKLKYRHSPRTDSVIQMSEESQSYDIIFKDDF